MVRIPIGLVLSVLVAAASVVGVGLFWAFEWPAERGLALLAHTSAPLCLASALVGYLLKKDQPGFVARPLGKDLLAVLQVAAMVMGLATVIIMLYAATTEALLRTVYSRYEATLQIRIWRSGFIDLAAVGAAILLAWRQSRTNLLITALFWIVVLAGLWASFQIPAFRIVQAGAIERGVATRWASVFMATSAASVAVFAIAQGAIERRRRRRAWPDALWLLTAPPVHWPGFRYSAGVVAVGVLILGCVFVAVPWTIPCALATGASMLALASRRWNENLADTGLALITLGVVSLLAITSPVRLWWTAAAFAEIFNRALVGLAIMTAFWYWLAGVWKQQLDDGRAWTTAGRLIRTAERVGYLIGALAVLMSFHLALWPKLPDVADPDTATSRWIWGLTAGGLLVGALTYAARRTGRPTTGWLVLFAVASTTAFALVRSPHSPLAEWLVLHWTIALSALAGAMLLLAVAVSRTEKWRAFSEPTYLTGILIAPVAAIAGVSLIEQLRMPLWISAATFGCLAGVYLLAAVLPGPRAFAAVALICAITSAWHLQQLSGSYRMPAAASYGILAGLSVSASALVCQSRAGPGTVRFLKWAGGALALVSAVAAWISSRG